MTNFIHVADTATFLEITDDEAETLQEMNLIAEKCGDCSSEDMTIFHPISGSMGGMKQMLETVRGYQHTN